jgi:hypothetical protein
MTRELPTPSPARLRFLARQTHRLGERPLYELLLEVRDGADLWDRLEAYARPRTNCRLRRRTWRRPLASAALGG